MITEGTKVTLKDLSGEVVCFITTLPVRIIVQAMRVKSNTGYVSNIEILSYFLKMAPALPEGNASPTLPEIIIDRDSIDYMEGGAHIKERIDFRNMGAYSGA